MAGITCHDGFPFWAAGAECALPDVSYIRFADLDQAHSLVTDDLAAFVLFCASELPSLVHTVSMLALETT